MRLGHVTAQHKQVEAELHRGPRVLNDVARVCARAIDLRNPQKKLRFAANDLRAPRLDLQIPSAKLARHEIRAELRPAPSG